MASVEKRIKSIISEQLSLDEKDLRGADAFIEDLGADSLDIVELIMAMEEDFDLEIPDEEAEKIVTVQNAIDYVKDKLK